MEKQPREANVDISGLDRTSIIFVIRGLYRAGFDTIALSFNSPMASYPRIGKEVRVSSIIREEVNRLIGFEIMQDREKLCVLKNLQIGSMKDFSQLLQRIFLILNDNLKDCVEGIKNQNWPLVENTRGRHDTLTRYISYCLRLLNLEGCPEPEKTAYTYYILTILDRVSDTITFIAEEALAHGKRMNSGVMVILQTVAASLTEYSRLYYKYSNEKIKTLNINRYKAGNLLRRLPKSTLPAEFIIAATAYQMLEMTLDLIEALMAIKYPHDAGSPA